MKSVNLFRWGLLFCAACLLTAVNAGSAGDTATITENERAAVGAMRTLNTALYVYRDTYKMGFAHSLGVLAKTDAAAPDSAWAANLINPELARGVWKGYKIIYRPGSDDSSGHIQTYTLSVRPLEYSVTGQRSFCTNDEAIIRSTGENRECTTQDPPL